MALTGKTILVFVFSSCAAAMSAQGAQQETTGTENAREIWTGIHDLSPINLSLGFKHEIAPKWFMSYRLSNLQFSSNVQDTRYHNESALYSGSGAIGIERRHNLTENLLFFHGPEVSVGGSKQNFQQFNDTGYFFASRVNSVIAGLGYRLGMILQIKKHGFVALHIAPYLTYTETKFKGDAKRGTSDFTQKNLMFSIYSLPEFTFGYRF